MKMRREHCIPLPSQAIALLKKISRKRPPDQLVFTLPQSDVPLSENAFNQRIHKLGWKGKHTAHGFRSSASTYLHGAGYDSLWIETQLSHADTNQIRSAYNSADYLEDRRKMMQDWADLLDAKVVEATQKVLATAR
jgi:integrase